MKLCAGLLTPQSGSVSLDGVTLGSGVEAQRAWRRERCAYLDQESSLVTSWSVFENLSLVHRDRSAQVALLNKFDLHDKGSSPVSQLSGGERQRVAIARLLLRQTRLALVDEPTAHLDDRHTKQVLTEMARHFRDSVLIVVSHDRRVEEFVSKVIAWRGVQK
jgi:ABC-type lipoprotein export system ATPase subunit